MQIRDFFGVGTDKVIFFHGLFKNAREVLNPTLPREVLFTLIGGNAFGK